MRIVYAPRALRDIDEILAYIQARSPRGAHSLSLAIEYAIHVAALSPHAGVKTDQPHLYRRPLRKYRYTIFYRALLDRHGIEVVRVIHGARIKDLNRLPEDD